MNKKAMKATKLLQGHSKNHSFKVDFQRSKIFEEKDDNQPVMSLKTELVLEIKPSKGVDVLKNQRSFERETGLKYADFSVTC